MKSYLKMERHLDINDFSLTLQPQLSLACLGKVRGRRVPRTVHVIRFFLKAMEGV
jgi:hypothetical protein